MSPNRKILVESFSAEKFMKNKPNDKKLEVFSVSESAFDDQLGKALTSQSFNFVFSGRGTFIYISLKKIIEKFSSVPLIYRQGQD